MGIGQVVLVALLSVAALFVIAKVMGHKQLAQLDFFDYISGITIGSIAAELAAESNEPLRPLIALAVYGAASVVLGLVTHKFPKTRKFINGSPTILMNNGKLYRKNLKKSKLDLSEFMVLCRQQGYFRLQDIQTAVFEHTGKLTILPVSAARPATPADMALQPPPERIQTEIIMDGCVLDENLKRMGRNRQWLQNRLKAEGHPPAHKIFLALYEEEYPLIVFPVE